MVQAVQNTSYYPSYSPATTATIASVPVASTGTSVYAGDTYQSTSTGTFDANKQAGGMKRMINGMGNAFGRMADWVGLGTISHYAKQNFQLYDANRSNHLDSTEFNAVSQLIQQSFQQVDSNTDQQISFGEFKRVIGDLVDANFKAIDTSGDGFLNYAETNAAGYVLMQGNKDTFTANDGNQDQLLSRNEFAGLLNDTKLKGLR